MKIDDLKLCLLTQRGEQPWPSYREMLHQAIDGGVTSIQLREKTYNETQLYYFASELKHFLTPLSIPLIINDHVDLAIQVQAEGLHLGQSDITPTQARERLKSHQWIGLSIESMAELAVANTLTDIDYVAASAVFPSRSKSNCAMFWGLDGLGQLVTQSHYPVVAIGGIDQQNIAQVIRQGVCGVAVISAIHDAPNPQLAAQQLRC